MATVALPDDGVAFWLADGTFRRPASADVSRVTPIHVHWSVFTYFADASTGWLRGFEHVSLGAERTWGTRDGGATWFETDPSAMPYRRIVPFDSGALAVLGSGSDEDDIDHLDDIGRVLYTLHGAQGERVYRAPDDIRDVSVDPEGRVLVELDPTPDTRDDLSGRYWLAVGP
jgi:hypothetical protein